MKNLPIGIQSFEKLRSDDFLYIDKTQEIYRLVTENRILFLSRPRRFGKSLLISTMHELFKGNKALFEGLWIYDKWDWTQSNPVIRLDWTAVRHGSAEEIEISMAGHLHFIAKDYDITLTQQLASDRFKELITELHKKTGQKVAVLIDEYDSPILDTMGSPEMKNIQSFLQSFYKQLKANDDCLRFIFLTGVSKFAKLSIFSTLNNPRDITMSNEYVALCGYTQEELEHYFPEHIDALAEKYSLSKAEILDWIHKWYNGYSWDGKTRVYNPFSTLLLFTEKEFLNYWFASGTPKFLIDQLKRRDDIQLVLEPVDTYSEMFDSFDPEHIENIPLLFQTGYLTVKSKKPLIGTTEYILDVPNMEVRDSLMKYLLSAYSYYPLSQLAMLTKKMMEQIKTRDEEGFAQSIRIMIENIPYTLQIENEKYYHSLFLAWMTAMGFRIQGEVMTAIGRIDAVLEQPETIIVSELKFHAKKRISTLLKDAMAQIYDRRYYEKYQERGKKILLMGLAFTGKEVGCRIEELR